MRFGILGCGQRLGVEVGSGVGVRVGSGVIVGAGVTVGIGVQVGMIWGEGKGGVVAVIETETGGWRVLAD
jgi:hypothetical protein